MDYNLLATILASYLLEKQVSNQHENCVFEGPYILQDYSESSLYYTFWPHWHLSVRTPFPAVVLLMAGQVTGTAPAGSLQLHHGLDADTACSTHLVDVHLTISQATYFVIVCGPNYNGKQLECLGESESNEVHPVSCQHIPSSPLSKTQTSTMAASRQFHTNTSSARSTT